MLEDFLEKELGFTHQQAFQVVQIRSVVTVTNTNSIQVHTLIQKNLDLLISNSFGSPSMGIDRRARFLMCTGNSTENNFPFVCHTTHVVCYLDNSRLDTGSFDPFL